MPTRAVLIALALGAPLAQAQVAAPSAIPQQCLWLPVFGYAPLALAPAYTRPIPADQPAPTASTIGPNWFFTVPGWQALTNPPAASALPWPVGPCPAGIAPWLPYANP